MVLMPLGHLSNQPTYWSVGSRITTWRCGRRTRSGANGSCDGCGGCTTGGRRAQYAEFFDAWCVWNCLTTATRGPGCFGIEIESCLACGLTWLEWLAWLGLCGALPAVSLWARLRTSQAKQAKQAKSSHKPSQTVSQAKPCATFGLLGLPRLPGPAYNVGAGVGVGVGASSVKGLGLYMARSPLGARRISPAGPHFPFPAKHSTHERTAAVCETCRGWSTHGRPRRMGPSSTGRRIYWARQKNRGDSLHSINV